MKKATPQYQQSSPSRCQSITALSLFKAEEFVVGLLIPLALIALYWLWETSK